MADKNRNTTANAENVVNDNGQNALQNEDQQEIQEANAGDTVNDNGQNVPQNVEPPENKEAQLKTQMKGANPSQTSDTNTSEQEKDLNNAKQQNSNDEPSSASSSDSEDEEAEKKLYYDTSSKRRRGRFCLIQHDQKNMDKGNQRDYRKLHVFFKDILRFDFRKYENYSDLIKKLKDDKHLEQYYCVVICISAHGDEDGIALDIGKRTIHEITNTFSNKEVTKLSGVPKIFFFDVCRGGKTEKTSGKIPDVTSDSDWLVINSTTHEKVAYMQKNGSVGIQGVIKVLKANWQKSHLEEMLIDARRKVASWNKAHNDGLRQTLEIQTTLLKRLQFVKSKKEKQNVHPEEESKENK